LINLNNLVLDVLTNILILNKSIFLDQSAVKEGGFLGRPWPLWIIHIHIVETKLLSVTHAPLKVVQQRPGVVAFNRQPILNNGSQELIEIMFVVVDPLQVVKIAKFVTEAILRDINIRIAELAVGPVQSSPDAPWSHLEPGRSSSIPGLVLIGSNIRISVETDVSDVTFLGINPRRCRN